MVVARVCRLAGFLGIFVGFALGCSTLSAADSRLETIRRRGSVGCGVMSGVAGFALADRSGAYTGLDIDMCRAVAAAIFGTPDRVRFYEVSDVATFLRSPDIDLVSRRLSWTLEREGTRLLFGPIMFYDWQGFLVPKRLKITSVTALRNPRVCVRTGMINDFNLDAYARRRQWSVRKVLLQAMAEAAPALREGRCDIVSGDVSELGSLRISLPNGDDYEILPEQISKEPLAQVVRQGDDQFFTIVRWTVLSLIAAEELGITSENVEAKRASDDLDVQRLLGVIPGNGRALGLEEHWAASVIRAVGNYGEVFERNVGMGSRLRLERGLNRLWTEGGLMYAPLLRP